jgi:hypothetical protein
VKSDPFDAVVLQVEITLVWQKIIKAFWVGNVIIPLLLLLAMILI